MQTNNLWYAYPGGLTALRDVSLSFCQSEFVAIMGRNASGKTTFIKHLNALLKPTKGEVIVSGVDTRKVTVAELSRTVGFVFQNPNDHLFADSVEDEIAFTLKSIGFEGKTVTSRVDEMLEQFKITEYRKQYPRYLSGGERQRVALASVIVAKPKILILDEPTRGMDYRLKTELMNFLNEYRKDGNIVIMVTHDVEIVAEYADRVILLSEGKVVVDDDKRKVLSNALLFSPQMNRLVQAFEKYDVPQDILTAVEALEIIG
jgi:energy-coupling factor transport system ATP-binding protein